MSEASAPIYGVPGAPQPAVIQIGRIGPVIVTAFSRASLLHRAAMRERARAETTGQR